MTPNPDDDGCFGRMVLYALALVGACYIIYRFW